MKNHSVFAIAMWVLLLSAPGLCGQSAAMGGGGGGAEDVLRPGDQIRLSFWREPEYSGVYDVDAEGRVVLPFVGRQTVAFRAARDVKSELMEAFDEQLLGQEVQVIFLKRIRVLGAVNRPGIFQVDPTMTLSDVVALAGGARTDGALEKAQVLRGTTAVMDLDLSPLPIGPGLQSGDEVFVPRQSWFRRNSTAVFGTAASLAVALVYRGVIR